MNCSQMKMLLPPFASDELSEEDREMVHRHLARCAHCRSELEAIRALQVQLALLETLPVDTEIVDSIIARLRWRTTDTRAPEASMDTMDKLSSYTGDKGETNEDNELNKETVVDLPLDSDGNLLPDWRLQRGQ